MYSIVYKGFKVLVNNDGSVIEFGTKEMAYDYAYTQEIDHFELVKYYNVGSLRGVTIEQIQDELNIKKMSMIENNKSKPSFEDVKQKLELELKDEETKQILEKIMVEKGLIGQIEQPKPSFNEVLKGIEDLLKYKESKYGKADDSERLPTIFKGKCKFGETMDNKLNRIKNGETLAKNDLVDLAGYLVLTLQEFGHSDFSEFMD